MGGGGICFPFAFVSFSCFVCLFSIAGVWPISMIVIKSKMIGLYSHSHHQIHLRSVFHPDSLNQLRVHVPKATQKINSVNQSCFCLPTFSSLFFFVPPPPPPPPFLSFFLFFFHSFFFSFFIPFLGLEC